MSKNKQAEFIFSYNEQTEEGSTKPIETYVKIAKRHYKKGEFYMTHKSLDDIILEHDYSGLTFRVLTALKQRLDFNNRIKGFRQVDLAEQLKTTQQNVSKCIKVLMKDKIIIKDGIDYYFNEKYIKGAGDK